MELCMLFQMLLFSSCAAQPILEYEYEQLVLLPDDHARLRYSGRVDHRNATAPAFSWVMTGVACAVQSQTGGSDDGPTLLSGIFMAPKDGARLRVLVDGVLSTFVLLKGKGAGQMATVELVAELPPGNHTVEIFKVSEDNAQHGSRGVMRFGGFVLGGSAAEFGPAPAPKRRRLEFIGDSDTAGWCADGSKSTGDAPNQYQDAYQTWAMQVARNVSAEVMVQAVSGYGVTSASTPIQPLLDSTCGFQKEPKWNYSSWTPDAVVILIGPNDEYHGAQGHKGFISSYLSLLEMVAFNYAGAAKVPKLVHVCGGSLNGLDPCDDIQTANKQFNAAAKTQMVGHYTSITVPHWHEINGKGSSKGKTKYNGCDGHYNVKGHGVLAGDIIPQLRTIMGWEL